MNSPHSPPPTNLYDGVLAEGEDIRSEYQNSDWDHQGTGRSQVASRVDAFDYTSNKIYGTEHSLGGENIENIVGLMIRYLDVINTLERAKCNGFVKASAII